MSERVLICEASRFYLPGNLPPVTLEYGKGDKVVLSEFVLPLTGVHLAGTDAARRAKGVAFPLLSMLVGCRGWTWGQFMEFWSGGVPGILTNRCRVDAPEGWFVPRQVVDSSGKFGLRRHIICAAYNVPCRILPDCPRIKQDDYVIVPGARHLDGVMRQLAALLGISSADLSHCESGFVCAAGLDLSFINREDAWKIAEAEGQIIHDVGTSGLLFSENLY